jgi:hypothetical protein
VNGKEAGWEGVLGFAELRDRQVWAFGGHDYGLSSAAFIRRVDQGKAEDIYVNEYDKPNDRFGPPEGPRRPPPDDRPCTPIAKVVEEPNGDLLLFSYRKVFGAAPGFERWAGVREMTAGSTLGWLDEDLETPFVVDVHPMKGPEHGVVCATAWDGYIRLIDGKEARLTLPGQLGSERINRIISSREGTILRMENRYYGDNLTPPWRLGRDGWAIARFEVPFERRPDEPNLDGIKVPDGWESTEYLAGPDGTLYTISMGTQVIAVEGRKPAAKVTARWRNGKPEILSRESSQPWPSFITPDGSLWSIDETGLSRLVRDHWTRVAELTPKDRGALEPRGPARDEDPDESLRVLSTTGPPWFIHNRAVGDLHRFSFEPNFKDLKIEPIKLSEDGRKLRILDALPWANGTLLLATDKGLRKFEVSTGKLAPSGIPEPGRAVSAMARDGLGRLWLAGEGVWLVAPDGKTLHDCEALPMLGKARVTAFAADRDHRDGVIVAVGGRGVVFVRVP